MISKKKTELTIKVGKASKKKCIDDVNKFYDSKINSSSENLLKLKNTDINNLDKNCLNKKDVKDLISKKKTELTIKVGKASKEKKLKTSSKDNICEISDETIKTIISLEEWNQKLVYFTVDNNLILKEFFGAGNLKNRRQGKWKLYGFGDQGRKFTTFKGFDSFINTWKRIKKPSKHLFIFKRCKSKNFKLSR